MLRTDDGPPASDKHNERYVFVNTLVMQEPLITSAMNPPPGNLLAERFRLLLEQLAAKAGGRDKHGVRTSIGRKLGLHQAHVSMLLEGNRNATWSTIAKARAKYPVRAEFFTDPSLSNPNHETYLDKRAPSVKDPQPEEAPPPPQITNGRALTGLEMLSLLEELKTTRMEQADLGELLPPEPTREVVEATLRGLRGAVSRRKSLDGGIDAMDEARGRETGRTPIKRKG